MKPAEKATIISRARTLHFDFEVTAAAPMMLAVAAIRA
jgi:hypothetical protein